MLKAIAFDLDGTVLALDEARLIADIARKSPLAAFPAVSAALFELNANDRDDADTATNREHYARSIERRLGVPLDDPAVADVFDFYEREVLPRRNDAVIGARPAEGADRAIEAALDRGLEIALFTNPCFSRACIDARMGWARVADAPFEHVTSWDNTTRTKPSAIYYREALEAIGLGPGEVLMVGNDRRRDLPSPDIGLRTAYVGGGRAAGALWSGTMAQFADGIDEVIERFAEA